MSINVTVQGSPVNIHRNTMCLRDVEFLKKQEIQRRRQLRIKQVRDQSREIARHIRLGVKEEKGKQLREYERNLLEEQKKEQRKRILSLQKKYQECLEDVGKGHRDASLEPNPEEVLAEERKRWRTGAVERGQTAVERLRAEEEQARQEQEETEKHRAFIRTVEDLRSSIVSSLPKKKVTKSAAKCLGHKKRRGSTPRQKQLNPLPEVTERTRKSVYVPPLHGLSRSNSPPIPPLSGTSLPRSKSSTRGPPPDNRTASSISETAQFILNAARLTGSTGTSASVEEEQRTTTSSSRSHHSTGSDSRLLKRSWIQAKADELRAIVRNPPSEQPEQQETVAKPLLLQQTPLVSGPCPLLDELTDGQKASDSGEAYSNRYYVQEILVNNSPSQQPPRIRVECHVPRQPHVWPSNDRVKHNPDPLLPPSREPAACQQTLTSQPVDSAPSTSRNKAPPSESVSHNPFLESVPPLELPAPCCKPEKPVQRVQFYDHSNRFERQYHPRDLVEKVDGSTEPDACKLAEQETVTDETASVRVVAGDRTRTRCQQALAKERVHRDYQKLLGTLSGLAKEERKVRAGWVSSLQPDVYLNDERRKERNIRRQQNMDSVFEGVYHTCTGIQDQAEFPGRVTISEMSSASRVQKRTVDSPAKLNVGQWMPVLSSPPQDGTERPAPEVDNDKSPAGSIIVGQIPKVDTDAVHFDRPSSSQQHKLENLLERIHVQRSRLVDEVKQDVATDSRASKRPADKDLSFDSTSSNCSTVSCPELPLKADKPPSTRTSHSRLTGRPTQDKDPMSDRLSHAESVMWKSLPGEDVLDRARRIRTGKNVPESSRPLQYEDLQNVLEQAEGSPVSSTARVSQYSLDMSLSRTERSVVSTNGSPSRSSSSTTVTTYNGVKIVVSVLGQGGQDDSGGTLPPARKHKHGPCKRKCKKWTEKIPTVDQRDTKTVDVGTSPLLFDKDAPEDKRDSRKPDLPHERRHHHKHDPSNSDCSHFQACKQSVDIPIKIKKSSPAKTVPAEESSRISRGKDTVERTAPHSRDIGTNTEDWSRASSREYPKWGDRLSHDKSRLEDSTSTAYLSPPDQMTAPGSSDLESLVKLLGTRRFNDPHSKFETNPLLLQYIGRVLAMSRESISDLNVSCSDVSSLSSDIVNQSSNKVSVSVREDKESVLHQRGAAEHGKQAEAYRPTRTVGTNVTPRSFNSEPTSHRSPPTSINETHSSRMPSLCVSRQSGRLQNVFEDRILGAEVQEKSRIPKIDEGSSHTSDPMRSGYMPKYTKEVTRDSPTGGKSMKDSVPISTKYASFSDSLESEQRDEDASTSRSVKEPGFTVPHICDADVCHGILSARDQSVPVSLRYDSTTIQTPLNDSSYYDVPKTCNEVSSDIPSPTFPPSRITQMSLEEYVDYKFPNLSGQYESLTLRCTKRINDLTDMIANVRREQQELLDQSPPTDDMTVLMQPRDFISSSSSNETRSHSKPPATLLRSSVRNGIAIDSAHELSTILEVDTPQTTLHETRRESALSQSSPDQTKCGPVFQTEETHKPQDVSPRETMDKDLISFEDADESAVPTLTNEEPLDFVSEMIRRKILTSPFSWMKHLNDPGGTETDVVDKSDSLREGTSDVDTSLEHQDRPPSSADNHPTSVQDARTKVSSSTVPKMIGVSAVAHDQKFVSSTEESDLQRIRPAQEDILTDGQNVSTVVSSVKGSTKDSLRFTTQQNIDQEHFRTMRQLPSTSQKQALDEGFYQSSEDGSKVNWFSQKDRNAQSQEKSDVNVRQKEKFVNVKSDSDSPLEDLESTFQRLGIGWASAMLRKTQEAMAISSSSSEYSPRPRTSRAFSRRIQQFPDVSYESSLPRDLRGHSTPIIISNASGGTSNNNNTANRRNVSFTGESEISAVNHTVSPLDYSSDLSIKTPNVSLKLKLQTSNQDTPSSSSS